MKIDTTVTVFGDPAYRLTLHLLEPDSEDDSRNNATLTLQHMTGNDIEKLLVDSLYCRQLRLCLKDFNKDGTPDVLVFHTSGARSNWSHYLYLADKARHRLTFVKGFTNLLNPEVDKQTGVITSATLYGSKVAYSFYRINSNGRLVKAGRGYESSTQ